MAGKIIGIHSYIGGEFSDNYHVSMHPFRTYWDAMVERQVISTVGKGRGGFLGVGTSNHPEGVIVKQILPDSAAEKAGLEKGDIIASVDGTPIDSYLTFNDHLKQKAPGDKVDFALIRDGEQLQLTIELGKRPEASGGGKEEKPKK